jgi:hypothetical protein
MELAMGALSSEGMTNCMVYSRLAAIVYTLVEPGLSVPGSPVF